MLTVSAKKILVAILFVFMLFIAMAMVQNFMSGSNAREHGSFSQSNQSVEVPVLKENPPEIIRLGYCPTMKEDAEALAKQQGFQLVAFGSASEVLSALGKGQIEKGLIGRKASLSEISPQVRETVLRPGYTLVAYRKSYIEYSSLPLVAIHTYLPIEIVSGLIPESSRIEYHGSKKEALDKIYERQVVLISWEDWKDDFELLITMNGTEKVKCFRGAFLYEI